MPFKIQRVPGGLQSVLSTSGGETPRELEDRIQGGIDLLQFYGLTQRQVLTANNPAVAAGGGVAVNLPTQWCVLFAISAAIVKTATMTALRASLAVNRVANGPPYYSEELGPFGATETGFANLCFVPPYPMLCPPGTNVAAGINVLGTDATANVTVFAEFGLMQ